MHRTLLTAVLFVPGACDVSDELFSDCGFVAQSQTEMAPGMDGFHPYLCSLFQFQYADVAVFCKSTVLVRVELLQQVVFDYDFASTAPDHFVDRSQHPLDDCGVRSISVMRTCE